MWCNQIFSLICNETVQNIIVCDNYEVANQIARMTYGNDAIAVDTTQYPLSIGDKYIDGIFYSEDGSAVSRTNTAEEDAREAQAKVNALADLQAEIDYRLSRIELGLA